MYGMCCWNLAVSLIIGNCIRDVSFSVVSNFCVIPTVTVCSCNWLAATGSSQHSQLPTTTEKKIFSYWPPHKHTITKQRMLFSMLKIHWKEEYTALLMIWCFGSGNSLHPNMQNFTPFCILVTLIFPKFKKGASFRMWIINQPSLNIHQPVSPYTGS